jgi:hypothetical protein
MRTDDHKNPTAFTTDIAHQAGLVLGTDYQMGAPFKIGDRTYVTAKLIGDPIALTIKVITAIGFYTSHGAQRWTYIALPKFLWEALSADQRRDVIGFMYRYEGGTKLKPLFPNYGKL